MSIVIILIFYYFISFCQSHEDMRDSEPVNQDIGNEAQNTPNLDPNVRSGNYFGYPGCGCGRRWGFGGYGGYGGWGGGGWGRRWGLYGRLLQKMNGINETETAVNTKKISK